MTCAQGLLRLLWGGGPKLECYGTASVTRVNWPVRRGLPKKKVITCFPAIDRATHGVLDRIQEASADKRDNFAKIDILFTFQIFFSSCSKSDARNKGQF